MQNFFYGLLSSMNRFFDGRCFICGKTRREDVVSGFLCKLGLQVF